MSSKVLRAVAFEEERAPNEDFQAADFGLRPFSAVYAFVAAAGMFVGTFALLQNGRHVQGIAAFGFVVVLGAACVALTGTFVWAMRVRVRIRSGGMAYRGLGSWRELRFADVVAVHDAGFRWIGWGIVIEARPAGSRGSRLWLPWEHFRRRDRLALASALRERTAHALGTRL